jgi:hypothetical protein
MAGGLLGLVAGFSIAALFAPSRDPAQPLANEWYIVAAFASAIEGAIGGCIVGLFDGLLWRSEVHSHSLFYALMGALIGAFSSALLPRTTPEMTAYRGVACAFIVALICVVMDDLVRRRRLTIRGS